MRTAVIIAICALMAGGCFVTARSHTHDIPSGSALETEIKAIDPTAANLRFRESQGNPNVAFWQSTQHGDQICAAQAGSVVHSWQTSSFLQSGPFCAPNVGQEP